MSESLQIEVTWPGGAEESLPFWDHGLDIVGVAWPSGTTFTGTQVTVQAWDETNQQWADVRNNADSGIETIARRADDWSQANVRGFGKMRFVSTQQEVLGRTLRVLLGEIRTP